MDHRSRRRRAYRKRQHELAERRDRRAVRLGAELPAEAEPASQDPPLDLGATTRGGDPTADAYGWVEGT